MITKGTGRRKEYASESIDNLWYSYAPQSAGPEGGGFHAPYATAPGATAQKTQTDAHRLRLPMGETEPAYVCQIFV